MDREELLKRYSRGERDFSDANLSGADLSGAYLRGADLRNASLVDADFKNVDFSGADLRNADLRGANLVGANLSCADLRNANLSCAGLRNANLRDADLRGANIDYTSWPIWCGSKHVKVDKKIAMQLASHFCTLICDDPEVKEAQALILTFAKKSHIAHHILGD